jgi:hypothetical protein
VDDAIGVGAGFDRRGRATSLIQQGAEPVSEIMDGKTFSWA